MLPTTGSTMTAAIGERFGYALCIRDAEGREAGPRLHQQGIHVPVIAALELHDQVAPGETASHADGRHGGFRARIHQAHHLDGGHGVDDGVRQVDLLLGGRAETRADGERLLERRQDLGMTVAQQQRTPRSHVIDVLVAVHVEEVRTLATRHKYGIPAHAAEGAHRRIHSAWYLLHRAAEEIFRLSMCHRIGSAYLTHPI
jgi:hypothetical protein